MIAPSAFTFSRAVLFLMVLVVAGCGSGQTGPQRYQVTGTVTIDSQPMPAGTIQFHSATQDVAGNAMGLINNGKFVIQSSVGPTAGDYKVHVSSIAPQAAPADPNAAMEAANQPPPREEVAPQFNAKTELTATVSADGNNHFDFQVKSVSQ